MGVLIESGLASDIWNRANLFDGWECRAAERFAVCAQSRADHEELEDRSWLTFWAGRQWGDEAPNRLFGSWLNQDGEAV